MEITEFFISIKTPATIAHLAGVVFGMGGALISDVLFSFFSRDKKLNPTELFTLEILAKVVFYSLIFIFISGVALFLSDPEKYLNSSKFLSKASILVVLLLNGYILNKYIWPHLLNRGFFTLKKERNIRRLAFACGAVSVISWISVLILGSLKSLPISYGAIMTIYLCILFSGMLVALLVEKKELN